MLCSKGTWDAVSLTNDRKSRILTHKRFVARALPPLGRFVIFSCDFKKQELLQMFEGWLYEVSKTNPTSALSSWDAETGLHRGFASTTFGHPESATRAMQQRRMSSIVTDDLDPPIPMLLEERNCIVGHKDVIEL
ncbi:unnamed protein product [Cylicocyclus nassatus]|uniref:Uncharacterized protein n=1 Tax=Cylicocyclus nassatus TaxID=53992 RepID=A0AA36DP45_CYLNA|nr:unnamed protein product [Cylicocyclus nassatus]